MKSYCKNFVFTWAHIEEAFHLWRKAQAGKKNYHRVLSEYGSEEKLIEEVFNEIAGKNLQFKPIHYYWHRDPINQKLRNIGVQSIKQQLVDYVVVLALQEFLDARIGYYQVASMPGKGQLFASRTAQKWIREGGYWVHMDVKQYYPSVNHDVVRSIIGKYVRSSEVRYVVDTLLGTYGRGLMIGSYFSLKMAQLVLSFAYHHLEGRVAHQLHYLDDVLLMDPSKERLKAAAQELERFLRDELELTVKPWKLCKVGDDEPIDIAGYVVRPTKTTLRSSIFLRARRSFKRFEQSPTEENARSVCAYWGWVKNTHSMHFQQSNRIPQLVGEAAEKVSNSMIH